MDDEWEVCLARFLERQSVAQDLTTADQKRMHKSYLEGAGQASGLQEERAKRLRLEVTQAIDKAPDNL